MITQEQFNDIIEQVEKLKEETKEGAEYHAYGDGLYDAYNKVSIILKKAYENPTP